MQTILRSQTAANVHSLNTLQRPPWASVNGSGIQRTWSFVVCVSSMSWMISFSGAGCVRW